MELELSRHMKIEDEISHKIIGAAIEVHRILGGPGLLESVYEAALCHELTLKGLRIQRQKPVQVVYKGVIIKEPMYIDILVEDIVRPVVFERLAVEIVAQ